MDESLIFVFRDLVTTQHQTIKLHKDLIDEYGYCWWGWWKKPIEEVPVDILERIVGSGDCTTTFLFDCGNYQFYEAGLSGVKVSPSDEGAPSPELEKTPAYYSHLRLVLWLRFASIQPVGQDIIKQYTYVDFPTWISGDYDQFKGKQIGGAKELDEMRVTLWHIARREDVSANT